MVPGKPRDVARASVKKIAVIGAQGFVGSAFVRQLRILGHFPEEVGRINFISHSGKQWDLVIDAAGSSRKYIADQAPWKDFALSVGHKAAVLERYPTQLHIHISSVDVYANLTSPDTTKETSPVGCSTSPYGFHKWIAEELVRYHCDHYLIFRLAGMVGPAMKKNPVFDVLQGMKLRIHPESRYQFLGTDDAARICLDLWLKGNDMDIFNVCGKGLITPKKIAELAGRRVCLGEADQPRIVDVNIHKLESKTEVPRTLNTIQTFIKKYTH